MENQVREREISIIDLLYFILKEWRKLVIAGIIGVVCFLALFVYKNKNLLFTQNNKSNNQVDVVMEDSNVYNDTVESLENAIDKYNNLISGCKDYQANSMMMKFDAFHVPTKHVYFSIQRDENEIINNSGVKENYFEITNKVILNSYAIIYLPAKLNWKSIAEKCDMEEKYLKEVVTITSDGLSSIDITIRHIDNEVIEKISSLVINEINSLSNEVAEKTYPHRLSYTSSEINDVVDYTVLNKQVEISNKIRDYNNCINDANTKLTKYKKENSASNVVATGGFPVKKILKYVIIGAFLGCFIIAFYYFCIYIFKGLLHTDDEIKCMYGVEHFGTINTKVDTKKNNFIDKLIRKWFKHNVYTDGETEALNRISVFVDNIETKEIAVIGTGNENIAKDYIQKLQKVVSGKVFNFIGNPVKYPEVSKELSKLDNIIFVEELEKSNMNNINLEYNLAMSLGKKIEGYIIVA